MTFRFETAVRAAESGVRAARKTVAHAIDQGQARGKQVARDSGRRAQASAGLAEKALIGVMGALAEQGRGYARTGKHRIYEAEGRLFPRRAPPRIGTAVIALGAGVLLSLLFRPGRASGVEPLAAEEQAPLATSRDI